MLGNHQGEFPSHLSFHWCRAGNSLEFDFIDISDHMMYFEMLGFSDSPKVIVFGTPALLKLETAPWNLYYFNSSS